MTQIRISMLPSLNSEDRSSPPCVLFAGTSFSTCLVCLYISMYFYDRACMIFISLVILSLIRGNPVCQVRMMAVSQRINDLIGSPQFFEKINGGWSAKTAGGI